MDDNEIKRRLAGRAAEYMMFKDDEEDTEVPADISLSDSVNDFSDLEESKNKIQSDIQSDTVSYTHLTLPTKLEV